MASTLTVDNIVGATTAAKVHITGHVVQVVNAKYDTEVVSTSNSASDTGLTASITPSSTSNKILVLVAQPIWMERSGGESMFGYWTLVRGSTTLTNNKFDIEAGLNNESDRALGTTYAENYLDSPSTTSAITYKTQMRAGLTSASPQVASQKGGSGYYSTITLMEIAQ
jgi:hypothetical protein|tara:strand:- start:26 stop:529 length:504 start_codon:yes stop_codon:yes gene_type:complete